MYFNFLFVTVIAVMEVTANNVAKIEVTVENYERR